MTALTPLEVMQKALACLQEQAAEADDPKKKAELLAQAGKIAAQLAPYIHPHAIWPETAGRPIARPKVVAGVRRRKPPMTHEAKRAIRENRGLLWQIERQIDQLSEPSLKAFIAQAKEDATDAELVEAELWKGLANAAQRRLEILKARRSNKGKWIAVVRATIWGKSGSLGRATYQTRAPRVQGQAGRRRGDARVVTEACQAVEFPYEHRSRDHARDRVAA